MAKVAQIKSFFRLLGLFVPPLAIRLLKILRSSQFKILPKTAALPSLDMLTNSHLGLAISCQFWPVLAGFVRVLAGFVPDPAHSVHSVNFSSIFSRHITQSSQENIFFIRQPAPYAQCPLSSNTLEKGQMVIRPLPERLRLLCKPLI